MYCKKPTIAPTGAAMFSTAWKKGLSKASRPSQVTRGFSD
jgi:hypothetical protein